MPTSSKSKLSVLWKEEDYWTIWLGFIILIIGILIFFPRAPEGMHTNIAAANSTLQSESEKAPFKTVEWFQAVDTKKKIKANSQAFAKSIATFLATPHSWKQNPLDAFFMSEGEAKVIKAKALQKYNIAKEKETEALLTAITSQQVAEAVNFTDTSLNEIVQRDISTWRDAHRAASNAKKKTKVAPYNQVLLLIGLCVLLGLLFSIGTKFMGRSAIKFFLAFFFVFGLAVLAYLASKQITMKHYGIGYAAWAILFGLIISNTVGTPKWVMPAVQVEYFIKTGLVLLGAEILFGKIISIGIPGIFVAWIVTPIVLVTTYIVGQKIIKMPSKTLNITISADMSVCGVSAAIATAAACKAKKEELTLAVGMSLVFTSIMMIVMPIVIKAIGLPQVLGGAWMGGTIDSTGAVAAAGAFLGEKALYVAATIKMIQNVLIGVIAFCVAVYWCAKVEAVEGQRVSLWEIWYRFPKFVLGFIGASIIFSIIYASLGSDVGYVIIDHGVIRGLSKSLRGWFFCLAFASIGLATNFRELKHYFKGGKPLILYVFGQSLNLCLTLLMAYIMFYLVFPDITANI
ncbi:MAG: putative sulfate exporter family transporter [Calditrichaeota bacterium]|nr:putative sulfate exporter family transporter [Calditrichota bacterium]